MMSPGEANQGLSSVIAGSGREGVLSGSPLSFIVPFDGVKKSGDYYVTQPLLFTDRKWAPRTLGFLKEVGSVSPGSVTLPVSGKGRLMSWMQLQPATPGVLCLVVC